MPRALGPTTYRTRAHFHRFGVGCRCMSFLDQLAFGPGRDRRAWVRVALVGLAVIALAGGLLYYAVSGDYAFLRSIFTGSPTGAYHALGDRLASRALKKNGHLKVVATARIDRKHRPPHRRKRPLHTRLRFRTGWIADASRRRPRDARTAAAAGDAVADGPTRARDQHLQRPQGRFGGNSARRVPVRPI